MQTGQKTILITGSTDGIGLAAASLLAAKGHRVLLHGRNREKLEHAEKTLKHQSSNTRIETYLADLSRLTEVIALGEAVAKNHAHLDVLINNAGVFRTANPKTQDGLDVRFVVNAIAPYLLTKMLLPCFNRAGRVVNVSSAAQSPVDLNALAGNVTIPDDFTAYAQSKLAITMWSRYMAMSTQENGLIIVAINPGSMLGTKMVKEGFGVAGGDIQIGAEILVKAALSDEFESASGKYFDNDSGQFALPHPDALNTQMTHDLVLAIEKVLAESNR